MGKHIQINGPAYRGARYPEFNPLAVNEENFEDGLRCKDCIIEIGKERGRVQWIAQEDDRPTSRFNAELLRAFDANGCAPGYEIDLEFKARYEEDFMEYVLTVK